MDTLSSSWKAEIACQLKQHNRQWHVYDDIIQHYNRLSENNAILQIQCIKLEKDVHHLRLANAGLEKASEASQALANVNNKLTVANEEVMMHLREKGELAREVLRLNHALTDSNDKLAKEEAKTQQYKIDTDEMREKIDNYERETNELGQINQILRDEFQAVQSQLDQLKIDYNRLKPTSLELESQLLIVKRTNKQLEDELIQCKNSQIDMLNSELERHARKLDQRRESETGIFADGDLVIIPPIKRSSEPTNLNLINSASVANGHDTLTQLSDEIAGRERKGSANSNSGISGNLFASFMRKLTTGMTNSPMDRLNRTSTFCIAASLPAHDISQWDCTDLEVYALQFQPSGSLLATGCSDKMVHLWEISTTGQPRKYCSLQGSHGAINALDFDNEGSRLLVGCSGDKAYIWSYGEYKMIKDTVTGHTGLIFASKFVSSTKLATGSADRTLKLWDLQSRQCVRTLFAGSKCHDLVVMDAAGTLISGHFDKKIRTWDHLSDQCRNEMQFDAAITSLSYNAEKQHLLACLKDDTIKLIDLRQNRSILTFSHDSFKVSTDTTKAILSPDGRYACAGSQDGSLVVWNTTNGYCETVLKKRHTTMVTSVAWQPDGKYVASCEKHRRVVLWCD